LGKGGDAAGYGGVLVQIAGTRTMTMPAAPAMPVNEPLPAVVPPPMPEFAAGFSFQGLPPPSEPAPLPFDQPKAALLPENA
jgi:hypothetical protein